METREPKNNILIDRGNIQIKGLILMDVAAPAAAAMVPLHRTQLLNVRAQYHNRNYITKTDFTILMALFRKYESDLEQKFSGDDLTRFLTGMMEAKEHEEYITSIADTLRSNSSDSNCEIRDRVA